MRSDFSDVSCLNCFDVVFLLICLDEILNWKRWVNRRRPHSHELTAAIAIIYSTFFYSTPLISCVYFIRKHKLDENGLNFSKHVPFIIVACHVTSIKTGKRFCCWLFEGINVEAIVRRKIDFFLLFVQL